MTFRILETVPSRAKAQEREAAYIAAAKSHGDQHLLNQRHGRAGRPPKSDGDHVVYVIEIGRWHLYGFTRNICQRISNYNTQARRGSQSNRIYDLLRHFGELLVPMNA